MLLLILFLEVFFFVFSRINDSPSSFFICFVWAILLFFFYHSLYFPNICSIANARSHLFCNLLVFYTSNFLIPVYYMFSNYSNSVFQMLRFLNILWLVFLLLIFINCLISFLVFVLFRFFLNIFTDCSTFLDYLSELFYIYPFTATLFISTCSIFSLFSYYSLLS